MDDNNNNDDDACDMCAQEMAVRKCVARDAPDCQRRLCNECGLELFLIIERTERHSSTTTTTSRSSRHLSKHRFSPGGPICARCYECIENEPYMKDWAVSCRSLKAAYRTYVPRESQITYINRLRRRIGELQHDNYMLRRHHQGQPPRQLEFVRLYNKYFT